MTFGIIKSIENNLVTLENSSNIAESNILNFHVSFETNDSKIIGEIIGITKTDIKILLIGEIKDDIFNSGVIKKPPFNIIPRIVYKSELECILGSQDISNKNNLYIGKSVIYENYNITANVDNFFSSHFAILGNTGSGKSCGVARIIQNLFMNNEEIPVNAHLVIFDVYGEYTNAFSSLNNLPLVRFKNYTTEMGLTDAEKINIPLYYLDCDDLALLLEATSPNQLPIISKSLKIVKIFTSTDEKVLSYKNDIIANALLDILSSGKSSTQIRDQLIAVLTRFNTETLNLDTIISQPGYNRTIKQCLNIDSQGKINAISAVIDKLNEFEKVDLNSIEIKSDSIYNLEDLYNAFDFALISEGVLSSDMVFESVNILKVRLRSLINSNYREYFNVDKYIPKEEYINKLFSKENNLCQIITMNFNYIDERFAKVLTKVYSKLFFNYSTNLKNRASFPIHIILEEAHRYVQNDNDVNLLGYNIFDRITKEGRKYGVLLGLISQRPSELSKTALSQCANFIVFRMYHPEDIKIITDLSSNVSLETVEKIKTIRPGMAMVFGTSFNIPLLVKLDMPSPRPESTSVEISKVWYRS